MKKFILISAVALLLTACGDGGVSDYAKARELYYAGDRENALIWAIKAADQGHAEGAMTAGDLYRPFWRRDDSKMKLALSYYCKALDGNIAAHNRKRARSILLKHNHTCNAAPVMADFDAGLYAYDAGDYDTAMADFDAGWAASQLLGKWKYQSQDWVTTMTLDRRINERQVSGIYRGQSKNLDCRSTESVVASVQSDNLVDFQFTQKSADGDNCDNLEVGKIATHTFRLSADGNKLTSIKRPKYVYIKQ